MIITIYYDLLNIKNEIESKNEIKLRDLLLIV